MVNAVETEGLTKYYGRIRGIDEVSLAVAEGEVFGFIGPNGAGKTTTIRILLGLIRPTGGIAKLYGRPVPFSGGRFYRRVGYVPAEISYYPEMTGRDLLEYAGSFYAAASYRWIEELIDRLQFDPDRKIHSYSHGNKKKLGIIQALAHQPRLLVLDEPGRGLDPLVRQEFFKLLEELNQKGTTVFLSTHVLEEVERLCHRVAMIREGRIIHVGYVDRLPGREFRIVTLKVGDRKPSTAALARLGQAEELPARPGFYRVLTRLPVNDLVSLLSHFNLEYLRITDPSLEDVFLGIFDSKEEGDEGFD